MFRWLVAFAFIFQTAAPLFAAPRILVDADTASVLYAEDPIRAWFPASLTKMMTAHVALRAVASGEITMNETVTMSPAGADLPPSKIGLRAGESLLLRDALRIMLVRSANDIAYATAEAIAGSEEAFVHRMNDEAARLGMTGTHYVNPHGLHDDRQVTNARDVALLALAIIHQHARYSDLFRTPFVTWKGHRLANTNALLGRPGVNGMKTGYTCSSGWNLVVTSSREGRRLIAVVLGASDAGRRNEVAAAMLDMGGAVRPIARITDIRAAGPSTAEDKRSAICGRKESIAQRTGRTPERAVGVSSKKIITSDNSVRRF